MDDEFPIGTKVVPSPSYPHRYSHARKRGVGTVIGLSRHAHCRRVKWDCLVDPETIAMSFIRPKEPELA